MKRVSARYRKSAASGASETLAKQKPNPRDLWMPKRPELGQQCVSCPFRRGNDAEFGVIVERLNEHFGADGTVEQVRFAVQYDAERNGDFACHLTAYTETMDERPDHERRQCPGATAVFKAAGAGR